MSSSPHRPLAQCGLAELEDTRGGPLKHKVKQGLLSPGLTGSAICHLPSAKLPWSLKQARNTHPSEDISVSSVPEHVVSPCPQECCCWPPIPLVTTRLQGEQSRAPSERLLCPSWALGELAGTWTSTQGPLI